MTPSMTKPKNIYSNASYIKHFVKTFLKQGWGLSRQDFNIDLTQTY